MVNPASVYASDSCRSPAPRLRGERSCTCRTSLLLKLLPSYQPFVNNSTILPRVRSCGESSTRTRSPGRTLTKFTVAAPAACATIKSSFASFSRYAALGNNSTTTASSLVPGFTAWSKPRALRLSPPPYARNAPSTYHPRSPPSTCPASPGSPALRRSPSARSPEPFLLSTADSHSDGQRSWEPAALRASAFRCRGPQTPALL